MAVGMMDIRTPIMPMIASADSSIAGDSTLERWWEMRGNCSDLEGG